MAKIYGLFGSMQGKVADVVMAVRNGEQIVRKYQPVVSNPSTATQVAQRAKMKLMSQLSAVMAPVIAMPRQGAVSSRNLFAKENFGELTYANNQATANLLGLKLTKSVVALPQLSVSTRVENTLTLVLSRTINLDVDRVVYCVFLKQADNKLRFLTSVVQENSGVLNDFATEVELGGPYSVVVYAYGFRINNERARAIFSNMSVVRAENVANLLVTRTLTESDVTLTETRSAYSDVPTQNAIVPAPESNENRSVKKK